MQNKKFNVLSLIVIIFITLVVGIFIGYFVSKSLENSKEVSNIEQIGEQKLEEIKKEEPKIENTQNTQTTSIMETPKYDGSKSITIDGKIYKISYFSEKFEYIENKELKQTEVKLYLNDKKVKTLNLGYLIDVNHEFGDKDYGVELYTFCNEYILIVIKNKHNDGEYEPVNNVKFCIINTNGEHIDTLEWNDATQISDVKTGQRLTYEINDDSIILYEVGYSGAMKMKYTVIRDFIKKEILKSYNQNEVSLAGK